MSGRTVIVWMKRSVTMLAARGRLLVGGVGFGFPTALCAACNHSTSAAKGVMSARASVLADAESDAATDGTDGGTNKKNGESTTYVRQQIDWTDPQYYDEKSLEHEMRRVFDVCHGCRRCFNICNAFPKLFDMVDKAPSGELDSVPSSSFKAVVDDCTLCDLCFVSYCPYVPPHPFNIDFPHLMLQYRAVEQRKQNEKHVKFGQKLNVVSNSLLAAQAAAPETSMGFDVHVEANISRELRFTPASLIDDAITDTDLSGRIAGRLSSLANWSLDCSNAVMRSVLESVTGLHKDAVLPPYVSTKEQFTHAAAGSPVPANPQGAAYDLQKKVVLFSSCLVNYNFPNIGKAARAVLAHQGVEVAVFYDGCCGMPKLEQGDLGSVYNSAVSTAKQLMDAYVSKGYDVVGLTPSCTLMMKKEWPLVAADSRDVHSLSAKTYDVCEYLNLLEREAGSLTSGLAPLSGGIQLHNACHSRVQNMGNQALKLLRKIPKTDVTIVDKCSGHGGSWGCKSLHFDTALKVGKTAVRQIARKSLAKVRPGKKAFEYLSSECSLAGMHITQGLQLESPEAAEKLGSSSHPIEILAASYRIKGGVLPPCSEDEWKNSEEASRFKVDLGLQ